MIKHQRRMILTFSNCKARQCFFGKKESPSVMFKPPTNTLLISIRYEKNRSNLWRLTWDECTNPQNGVPPFSTITLQLLFTERGMQRRCAKRHDARHCDGNVVNDTDEYSRPWPCGTWQWEFPSPDCGSWPDSTACWRPWTWPWWPWKSLDHWNTLHLATRTWTSLETFDMIRNSMTDANKWLFQDNYCEIRREK